MLLLLLAACIENKLADDDAPPPFDSGEPLDSGGETGAPPEDCDGLDNDGDGEIDEGFSDLDGDGVADCVDEGCTVPAAAPRAELDADCQDEGVIADPPEDPWSFRRMWRNVDGPVLSTPAVGDLDQDGVPEVVAIFRDDGWTYTGDLSILDGATGAVERFFPGADATSGLALADLDGDGDGEVIAHFPQEVCTKGSEVRAYTLEGALLWARPGPWTCEAYPAVGDLDGDGTVEVVAGPWVLDGATGAVEVELPVASGDYVEPALVDMDNDGDLEILVVDMVLDGDGTLLWSCDASPFAVPQPVQADDDPAGELLVSSAQYLVLCDDGGEVLWERVHASLGPPIAVADFDEDGEPELAFTNATSLYLLETDGAELWEAWITDPSCCGAPVSWDIDLDGVPELVNADEESVIVFDGRTGEVRILEEDHASFTYFTTPVVADVDGDGRGEIVYGSDAPPAGLTVLRGADWPWAPTVYNQMTYYADNIGEDLAPPRVTPAPWADGDHLFRGQPSALSRRGDIELDLAITGVCAASCAAGGVGEVGVQVWNAGAIAAPAGVRVELWGDVDAVPTLLGAQSLPDPLAPQGSWEGSFPVPAEALVRRLEARVSTDALSCDPDDDTVEAWDLPCLR